MVKAGSNVEVESDRRKRPAILLIFLAEERGDLAPVSYLVGFMLALTAIFFTMDLGLRKGARLAVEYSAYCGARAAATQIPQKDEEGGCLDDEERTNIETATHACLASVVSKRNTFGVGLPGTGAFSTLIDRAKQQTTVRILGPEGDLNSGGCLAHNSEVTVEVSYTHQIPIPLSPFQVGSNPGIKMVAQASAMIHTIK